MPPNPMKPYGIGLSFPFPTIGKQWELIDPSTSEYGELHGGATKVSPAGHGTVGCSLEASWRVVVVATSAANP